MLGGNAPKKPFAARGGVGPPDPSPLQTAPNAPWAKMLPTRMTKGPASSARPQPPPPTLQRVAHPSLGVLMSKAAGTGSRKGGSHEGKAFPGNEVAAKLLRGYQQNRSPRFGRPSMVSSKLLDRSSFSAGRQTSSSLSSLKGPLGSADFGEAPMESVRDPMLMALMKKQTVRGDSWAVERRAPVPERTETKKASPPRIPQRNNRTQTISDPISAAMKLAALNSVPQRKVFGPPLGESTEESMERVKRRHRAKKKMPTRLTDVEVDLIVNELKKRRQIQKNVDQQLNHIKTSKLLRLTDDELLDVMMSVREQRVLDKTRELGTGTADKGRHRLTTPDDVIAARSQIQAPESPTGTKFLPAVWSLPHGKFKPPGVYLDDNLLKTGPHNPVNAQRALLGSGPFGVGEAKACLDDLQAHLLSYYSKLFKIEPNLPLEWQLEQLSRNYYPSPAPLSEPKPSSAIGMTSGRDLEPGTLPPNLAPTYDRRDESKTKIQKPLEKEATSKESRKKKQQEEAKAEDEDGDAKDQMVRKSEPANYHGVTLPQEPEGITKTATVPSVKRDVTGVMAELFDLAKDNGDKLSGMMKQINSEIGDATSRGFWRSDLMRRDGLSLPKYMADAPYVDYLGDLENDVETMYRNLRITAEWNNRKIRLMEDRLKILKQAGDRRNGL